MSEIDIKGIDKAALLAALYNGSHQQGMGFTHARGAEGMTIEQAQDELKRYADFGLYFDYLHGRVLKVDLSGDALRTDLYNRDNGEGAAERIVRALSNPDRVRSAEGEKDLP